MINNIESFINSTREVIFLREEDHIMIIRPNKIQHLNNTAFKILNKLYKPGHSINTINENITLLSDELKVEKNVLIDDINKIIRNINYIMQDDYSKTDIVSTIDYSPTSIKYPVISEIALTYNCQNKCDFCYASSPYRGKELVEMSTSEVKTIIDKINDEAKVPTISFTGGEPTLRKDLPELVSYASSKGMRTNLISNGIICSDNNFVKRLKDAGLNSAQISLESHDENIHNSIVGNNKAYKNVIKAVHNLKNNNIFTHTNTTICQKNHNILIPLVDFIKSEFSNDFLSMNMIIATGIARDNENIKISYSTIESILKPVLKHCEINNIKFVWYSPTPYCLFNPVDYNLGSKSCACVSGLLSVNPAGEILPCSSYNRGIGSLLKRSFNHIWNSDEATYYREKRFIPPICKKCEFEILCNGACPLYWENQGSFSEIESLKNKKPVLKNLLWKIENKIRVKSKGVEGLSKERL